MPETNPIYIDIRDLASNPYFEFFLSSIKSIPQNGAYIVGTMLINNMNRSLIADLFNIDPKNYSEECQNLICVLQNIKEIVDFMYIAEDVSRLNGNRQDRLAENIERFINELKGFISNYTANNMLTGLKEFDDNCKLIANNLETILKELLPKNLPSKTITNSTKKSD